MHLLLCGSQPCLLVLVFVVLSRLVFVDTHYRNEFGYEHTTVAHHTLYSLTASTHPFWTRYPYRAQYSSVV